RTRYARSGITRSARSRRGVTARGWVILTKDKNIRRPGPERDAVIGAKARVITLASGNMRGEVMAALFIQHVTVPFVAILGPGGLGTVLPRPSSDSGSSTP